MAASSIIKLTARRALSFSYSSRIPILSRISAPSRWNPSLSMVRLFSDDDKGRGGNDKDDKEDEKSKITIDDSDPFGVNFDDGAEEGGLGPERPPLYRRDSQTGRFTGEVQEELTKEERDLLRMTPAEREKLVHQRFEERWNDESTLDETGLPKAQAEAARQIRDRQMALNTFGRSMSARNARDTGEDGRETYQDEDGFGKSLTEDEFATFKKYMEKEHELSVAKDDIPTQAQSGETTDSTEEENPDLALKWMSVPAKLEMEGIDDPFQDLMPRDLNPNHLVNRRQAKRIPRNLLRYNNLALLRRYVTPSGQISNRIQSRLGARDQRKIARLVKRARNLGLIPYMGQFKVENHGDIYERTLDTDFEWEKEIKELGLMPKDGSPTKISMEKKYPKL